jgi:acetylornithine deacetylase
MLPCSAAAPRQNQDRSIVTRGEMTEDLTQRVFAEIDQRRDDVVEILQGLVRIPSITGSEGDVQDHVEQLFAQRGYDVDKWETSSDEILPHMEHVGEQSRYEGRPNVVGVVRGSGSGRSIMLNAHVDTVDPGDPSFWTCAPYSGHVDGDLLYGRGSCDMKGGLATCLLALDALQAAGVRLAGEVRIAATVGEEDGGFGALGTVLRGHTADATLITEPTRLALVVAQGGSLVFRLTVTGKSAHGAMRNQGVSAIEKFIPIFQDLLELEAERNRSLDHPLYNHLENKVPISVGTLHAGDWQSTVPEKLVAEGRIGLLPGEDMHEFQEQIRQRIMAIAEADPWMREHPPTLEWVSGQFAPTETTPDEPFPQAIIAAHQRVTGQAPPIAGVPYGADMRLFKEIGGMPCVMYGAGDVAVAHQNDEHISISDMQTAAKTIAALLIAWCGVEGDPDAKSR